MIIRTLLIFLFATMALQISAQSTLTQENTLTKENAQTHYAEFKKYFTDGTCSELALPYSAMTDEQLIKTLDDTPKKLVDIALKVKNNAWATREKEFRVAEYEPHSNVSSWSNKLNTYQYSYINNPTGITATQNDTLLIFIDDNLNAGTFIKLVEITKNDAWSNWSEPQAEKFLTKGLNLVTIAQPDVTLFITYAVTTDTTETSPLLADYPKARIHIEGGNVNGYFDKRRHNDEDWRDMLANHFKHYSVQVKGDRVMFHMERANIAQVCPNTITDAIGWWDQCVHWQHELMGVDKYHDRFNSMLMARDGYENMYMYANTNYTYYEYYTVKEILPWATVYADPGKMWGPAHEIGHINQGTINIVSCTESSNNLFANVQIHRTGKSTTRGDGVPYCMEEFLKRTPFPLRDNPIGKSRMFFQLYLYFHAAEKDVTFYPRLFDALRKDRLATKTNGGQVSAANDQLKFAEKCCEVAQMDLSEFFDAWGFFEPMDNVVIGDYGTYYVNLTKEEAEASRARMQKYPKKGGHLMFIEDRIKASPRTDGVAGNRLSFNEYFVIGTMGKTGQWGDYIDEDVKAEGYYYSQTNNSIEIITSNSSKGALGFKLYDAGTGKLLAFSNSYTLTIPNDAADKELRVVAAQADGTDYDIPNSEESEDEAMQKKALKALLSNVMYYTLRTTTTGDEIGHYYLDVVSNLKELYNGAKKAEKNSDTSVHSYKEWIRLLRTELKIVDETPDAFAEIKEDDVYKLENFEAYKFLCNDNMGVKGVTDIEKVEDRNKALWTMENTGEADCFYIKDKNGYYINDIATNGSYCNGKTFENAVVFRAVYNKNRNLSFVTEDGLYLAINSEGMAVGTEVQGNNTLWIVTRVEKGTTAIELTHEDSADAELFDLQGRKVKAPGKGIYIRNGKKIIY